jgi:NADH:ubiquinone oxidoreductase subunit 4 (subunit M)
LLLAMDGGQIAVFAVQDMLLFFLAWELELIPVYLLLAIWGGGSGNTPPPSSFSTPLGPPC